MLLSLHLGSHQPLNFNVVCVVMIPKRITSSLLLALNSPSALPSPQSALCLHLDTWWEP